MGAERERESWESFIRLVQLLLSFSFWPSVDISQHDN
jgi:hypothetical protein